MRKYNANRFAEELIRKTNGRGIPLCPYCGSSQFTSTDKLATILIGDELDGVSLGPSIPAGMVICENCGHMDFFALGALGLLPKGEGKDGK